jgi:hypothetical protein
VCTLKVLLTDANLPIGARALMAYLILDATDGIPVRKPELLLVGARLHMFLDEVQGYWRTLRRLGYITPAEDGREVVYHWSPLLRDMPDARPGPSGHLEGAIGGTESPLGNTGDSCVGGELERHAAHGGGEPEEQSAPASQAVGPASVRRREGHRKGDMVSISELPEMAHLPVERAELVRVSVEDYSDLAGYIVVCDECGEKWIVSATAGWGGEALWWRCPTGCNAEFAG